MAESASKPIDPGAEPPKPHTLEWIIEILRKHPDATLAQGEGKMLLAEIDRLRLDLNNCQSSLALVLDPDK